jgi:hypothetical protein
MNRYERLSSAIAAQVFAEELLSPQEREVLRLGDVILKKSTDPAKALEMAAREVPGFLEALDKVTAKQEELFQKLKDQKKS